MDGEGYDAMASTPDEFTSEETIQHLKDFKLAIEFKFLMKHAPGGVYLMPELDNIRRLHGVIFLRRGLYRDGVFRFQMNLPQAYNDVGTHPEIKFTPPVYNPLIDPVVSYPVEIHEIGFECANNT
jgi:ubiquitin-protein ligase